MNKLIDKKEICWNVLKAFPIKFSANIEDPASLEIKGSLALFVQDGHLLMRTQGQANSLARA